MSDPVAAALALLGVADPRVTVASRRPRKTSSTEPRAWVSSDDDKIYVGDWTDLFQKAKHGDGNALKALAAVIAHERFHKEFGDNEGAAYETQLDTLKRLKGPGLEMATVKAAQQQIAPRWRGWLKSRPTMQHVLMGLVPQ